MFLLVYIHLQEKKASLSV